MIAAGNAYAERLFCLIQPMFAAFVFELPALSVWTMMESITFKMKRCFAVLLFERISLPFEFNNWLTG